MVQSISHVTGIASFDWSNLIRVRHGVFTVPTPLVWRRFRAFNDFDNEASFLYIEIYGFRSGKSKVGDNDYWSR